MKKTLNKYHETLNRYKATERDKATFDYNGEKLSYPFSMEFDRSSDTEYIRELYRREAAWKLNRLKHEEELLSLPCKEKLRRVSKNAGLELLASSLEAVFVPLMIGGISVRFDGIRDRKEETFCNYTSRQNKIAEAYGYMNYGFY